MGRVRNRKKKNTLDTMSSEMVDVECLVCKKKYCNHNDCMDYIVQNDPAKFICDACCNPECFCGKSHNIKEDDCVRAICSFELSDSEKTVDAHWSPVLLKCLPLRVRELDMRHGGNFICWACDADLYTEVMSDNDPIDQVKPFIVCPAEKATFLAPPMNDETKSIDDLSIYKKCNNDSEKEMNPLLNQISFDSFRIPTFLTSKKGNMFGHVRYLDMTGVKTVLGVFESNIIDHLEDCEFVTSNKTGDTPAIFMESNLSNCAEEDILVKFASNSISIVDMKKLLKKRNTFVTMSSMHVF
jgi:hypothetical protein